MQANQNTELSESQCLCWVLKATHHASVAVEIHISNLEKKELEFCKNSPW